MTPKNTLQATIESLDAAAIPHMVAGSFASSLHGLARTTAGIDLVIDPRPGAVETFLVSLDRDRS